jgi:ABC-2 type transport system permease protein
VIGIVQTPLRILAIVGKELVEIVRRPGALVSLILGPFLIMAIFAIGFDGTRRPLETIVVIPAGSGLPSDVATYQELAGGGFHIAEVTSDRSAAETRLDDRRVDVVVIAPADTEARFRAGEQSVIDVLVNVVDPVQAGFANLLAAGLSDAVNRSIIERATAEGQGYALAAGETDAARIPPEVVAAPTRTEIRNVAPSTPAVIAFYGPAVLALIVQHVAVSLIALSLVRERMSGAMELFRVAPVSSAELLAGKVVAFGLICAAIAAATVALLVNAFDVPLLGDPGALAVAIGLLILASLGLGLAVAMVSDSERQAIQLSLLVLLASVFFSGFVLSIDEFNAPVRALAFLLPVTHGIRLIGDVMLRGAVDTTWQAWALAAIAAATMFLAWALLRRSMRQR